MKSFITFLHAKRRKLAPQNIMSCTDLILLAEHGLFTINYLAITINYLLYCLRMCNLQSAIGCLACFLVAHLRIIITKRAIICYIWCSVSLFIVHSSSLPIVGYCSFLKCLVWLIVCSFPCLCAGVERKLQLWPVLPPSQWESGEVFGRGAETRGLSLQRACRVSWGKCDRNYFLNFY